MNATQGTSSSAAKISGSFALGSRLFHLQDPGYAALLAKRSASAFAYALQKPGVTQTVSVRAPYIYAEENWTDDMELAAASRQLLNKAQAYSRMEPITPWLGKDTARHYQWYPFINLGHYELARQLKGKDRDTICGYYRQGIEAVWNKARQNAFYRGIPYIWCSNNLTVSFAIQCYWYRKLTGDAQFEQLEQANFDWIFGCNPWGTSMVYGLPSHGDTPTDPHSAFTHLKQYLIDGGLVDGPVYTSIYKNLIGIQLFHDDAYAPFQSDLAVYHDDYGDYSTNEPTMDGTASLIYLLAAQEASSVPHTENLHPPFIYSQGALIRGDTQQKKIALVFTGDTYAEGTGTILSALKNEGAKASFFLTGRFLRTPAFRPGINQLVKAGHYLGPHSDQHLLYADWNQRDRLLVTRDSFLKDLRNTYAALKHWGIDRRKALYFLPPFEWYNDSIAAWTRSEGLQLINYTPGTISMADYTVPEDKNYRTAAAIFQSITNQESRPAHLNGFILLMHIGAGPKRPDPFYNRLPDLLKFLKKQGYQMVTVNELLRF
jgi:peptidoglycan/xylan/chitin deacetylase (PgdA/CDA1 family)